jgi:hypothetical protein
VLAALLLLNDTLACVMRALHAMWALRNCMHGVHHEPATRTHSVQLTSCSENSEYSIWIQSETTTFPVVQSHSLNGIYEDDSFTLLNFPRH